MLKMKITREVAEMNARYKIKTALLSALFVVFSLPAYAVSLIHDAEIEDTLRAYANPIFREAGLNPSSVNIFIVNDPAINAFVAGGANMFIHTGLIMKAQTPEMLIGVIAHETGHIAGGHLAQGAEKLKDAQLGTVLSMVLGAAVAAGGGGDAGMAIMSAGQEVATRNFLRFSRSNESAADQAALNYLDGLNISAAGMLKVMEMLRQNENRSYGTPDPYTRTHPLSVERISHIRDHVMQGKTKENSAPASFTERHARMLAKLIGFLQPLDETLSTYPESDTSVPAHYARAIGYYRKADFPKALQEIDVLLKQKPSDPFFHELRGQFLFEGGKVAEGIQAYSKAVSLKPDSALILSDYGKVLLASANSAKDMPKAIKALEHSASLDPSNVNTWHLLAIAYGRQGNQGKFNLASAEEAMLMDKPEDAIHYAGLALKDTTLGREGRVRAADIKLEAEKNREDKKRLKSSPF